MNVFRSFNFGKIIKIVLPGFFSLMGIIFLFDSLTSYILGENVCLNFTKSNSAVSVLLSIPLTLVFGMTCNTIFFLFISNRWFVKWFSSTYPNIASLKTIVFAEITDNILSNLNFTDSTKTKLKEGGNTSGFLIGYIDLECFSFLQESYWNYFEYHVNMFLSSIICLGGSIAWSFSQKFIQNFSTYEIIPILITYVGSWLIYAFITIKAARLNYYKFQVKQLSYFSSLITKTTSEHVG